MTKWQKPYLDVPHDDYLTSEKYIVRMGFPLNYIPPLNDLIGPHENRYINLMKLGYKPISWISHWELKYWEKDIAENGWCLQLYKNKWYENKKNMPLGYIPIDYFIYIPGQEWRVSRLIEAFEDFLDGKNRNLNEARIGFLLGYTKQCVSTYLKRKELIDSGASKIEYNAPHLINVPKEETVCSFQ